MKMGVIILREYSVSINLGIYAMVLSIFLWFPYPLRVLSIKKEWTKPEYII